MDRPPVHSPFDAQRGSRVRSRWIRLLICCAALVVVLGASRAPTSAEIDALIASANAGNADAQYRLGFNYMAGRGVSKSEKKAIEWFRKAATQDHPRARGALVELGLIIVQKEDRPPRTTPTDVREPTVVSSSLDFGKYHALVIGNADYRSFPKLETATNDAEVVARILRDDYGFMVTTLIDATWTDLSQALADYRRTLSENDNLLIYYAGHGWRDAETAEAYWIPIDGRPDNSFSWISNANLITTLRGMDANHVIIVADSCFSGAITRDVTRGIRLNSPETRRNSYYERLISRRSRTALTSGGLEPVLDTGANGHSVFANAFIAALTENEGVVQGSAIFHRIAEAVTLEADQTPTYGDIRRTGHEHGDFLFVRRPKP